MAAMRSVKLSGVCSHAVRQMTGMNACRLLQQRSFRVNVSTNEQ